MVPELFQTKLNNHLRDYFAKKRHLLIKNDKRLGKLIDQIADVTLRGGDRMRPYLCAVGFGSGIDTVFEEILLVLLTLEIQHSYFLIHDDIMDRAETRRGGPTIHAYFTQNLRIRQPADLLGTSLAILAGDMCGNWAQQLWGNISPSSELSQAKTLFETMVEEVIIGQTSDVWGMQNMDEAAILAMYQAKSGNYSVKYPLLIGATLAGKVAILPALTTFGEAAGLAFQLKDDLLGVFGDEKHTGKSTSNDITEGKWTTLVAYAYKKANSRDKRLLLQTLGNPHANVVECDWVKSLFVRTGAKRHVEAKIHQLLTTAKKAVIGLPHELSEKLSDAANFIGNRIM